MRKASWFQFRGYTIEHIEMPRLYDPNHPRGHRTVNGVILILAKYMRRHPTSTTPLRIRVALGRGLRVLTSEVLTVPEEEIYENITKIQKGERPPTASPYRYLTFAPDRQPRRLGDWKGPNGRPIKTGYDCFEERLARQRELRAQERELQKKRDLENPPQKKPKYRKLEDLV